MPLTPQQADKVLLKIYEDARVVEKDNFPSTEVQSEPTSLIVRFYDPNIKAKDARGRTLDQILKWDDPHLERSHDYIQILFPLPESSMFSLEAPVIDNEVVKNFRSRADLRQRMSLSLNRMLQFYGFEVSAEPPEEGASPQETLKEITEEIEANASTGGDGETKKEGKGKGKQKEEDTTTATSAKPPSNPSAPTSLHGYRIVRGKNWQEAFRNWAVQMDHNHLRITRILRSLRVLGLQKECEAFFVALKDVYNDPQFKIGGRSMVFWERAVKQPLHIAPDGDRVGWLKEWEVNKKEENAVMALV